MNEPSKILAKLGLNESEIAVYMAMTQGLKSAREIMKVTRQKRPTVYYALGALERKGLIAKTGISGEGSFAVEPPSKLEALAKEQTLKAERLEAEIKSLVPLLQNKKSSREAKPAVAFFEGIEAVKSVIMGSLYCREKKISSIAPKNNFFWQVGADFVESYIAERVKNRIKTRNLWEEAIDKKIFKEYYEGISDVKILPEIMRGKFATTIFIYDDKTLYISSMGNSYALLVTSKEHADTMLAIFEGLWLASEKHPV